MTIICDVSGFLRCKKQTRFEVKPRSVIQSSQIKASQGKSSLSKKKIYFCPMHFFRLKTLLSQIFAAYALLLLIREN
ncbi:MAG TPA: hypothetical protein VNU95_05990 [Candidatus Acidoferrales bacterium]|nr:hypothetical protein [Candidatus Acidoferrales bacterium]